MRLSFFSHTHYWYEVVVVFFTLTDRPQTYPVLYVVANPVHGHKEVPRSTGHIMVTTRYSDHVPDWQPRILLGVVEARSVNAKNTTTTNRDPNRDKKLCDSTSNGTDQSQKGSSNLLTPYIESSLDRLGFLSPTHDRRSQQQTGQITFQPALINKSNFAWLVRNPTKSSPA